MIHLNVYKFDKTFDHTLRFCRICTPKSLQNVPKSPQITPEVTKIMHLGHIFFTGHAKQLVLAVSFPSPNWGKNHTSDQHNLYPLKSCGIIQKHQFFVIICWTAPPPKKKNNFLKNCIVGTGKLPFSKLWDCISVAICSWQQVGKPFSHKWDIFKLQFALWSLSFVPSLISPTSFRWL